MPRPVVVRHWMITVVVECPECNVGATVMLVGGEAVPCPSCGAPLACGGFHWDSSQQPTPMIQIGRRVLLGMVQ